MEHEVQASVCMFDNKDHCKPCLSQVSSDQLLQDLSLHLAHVQNCHRDLHICKDWCVKIKCVYITGQGILANILAGLGATNDSVTRRGIRGEVGPIMSCVAQAWQKLYIKLYINSQEPRAFGSWLLGK